MNIMLLNFWDKIAGIFCFIPKLLYFIVTCILSLIDLFQLSFKKLAGLEPIILNGEVSSGDTAYKLIVDALFNNEYPAIRTLFYSIIILAVFMLFVTSIIAIIRLEYSPDEKQGNSKSGVVKNFFKAIFSFLIIPVACFFGMFIFNSLVKVVDEATATKLSTSTEVIQNFDKWNGILDSNGSSFFTNNDLLKNDNAYYSYDIFGVHIPTDSQPFSGMVFKACAYNANRVRNNSSFYDGVKNNNVLGIFNNINSKNEAADIIDQGFAGGVKLKTTTNLPPILDEHSSDWLGNLFGRYDNIQSLSRYNVSAVFYFYDLWSFNYLIAFIAAISIGKTYWSFVLYLMQRLFEIVGLFMISPISVSLMPLDNGKSLGEWRKLFISKFILLAIMVGTINLINPIINICQEIKMFGIEVLDFIMVTFFLIAAFNAIDALNKAFTKLFGGEDFETVGKTSSAIMGNLKSGIGGMKTTGRFVDAAMATAGRGASALYRTGKGAARKANQARLRKRINNEDKKHQKLDHIAQEQTEKANQEFDSKRDEIQNNLSANNKVIYNKNYDYSKDERFKNEFGGLLEEKDDASKEENARRINEYRTKLKAESKKYKADLKQVETNRAARIETIKQNQKLSHEKLSIKTIEQKESLKKSIENSQKDFEKNEIRKAKIAQKKKDGKYLSLAKQTKELGGIFTDIVGWSKDKK